MLQANFADPEWDGEPIPEEPPEDQKQEKPFEPGDDVGWRRTSRTQTTKRKNNNKTS